MSLIFFPMSTGFMSHVDIKKRQCRPVEFKGQGPHFEKRNKGQYLINTVKCCGNCHQTGLLHFRAGVKVFISCTNDINIR